MSYRLGINTSYFLTLWRKDLGDTYVVCESYIMPCLLLLNAIEVIGAIMEKLINFCVLDYV